MARLPRLVVPHYLHHIVQIGNDRQPIFREEEDYASFLRWVREAARQFKVAIHAYVLMPDHLHILATPSDETGLGRMMQWIGRHYVPYYNAKYQRSGTLWQGRYKATILEPDPYFLLCSRYIEMNPVRAGVVSSPDDYPWSSYPHHVGVKPDPVITDHPVFWRLGNTPFDREASYRQLLGQDLPRQDIDQITDATLKGWPLGSDTFKLGLSKVTSRRVSPAKRGRPVKRPVQPIPAN